jgi:hypothetical protein
MSWYVQGVGNPEPLLRNLTEQIERVTCMEPEQSIKAKVGEVLALALEAMPAHQPVKVNASGSQSVESNPDGPPTHFTNTLTLTIEPLWGYVAE